MERFLAILQEEQSALREGDHESLERFAADKAALAGAVNAASGDRESWLASEGEPAGRAGMQGWLAAHPQDEEARDAWQRLLALAGEARSTNLLNGQLIAERLRNTQQALAILTAQAPAGGLYGPDGQSTLGTGSRIIDAA